jgi:hypothetical protein
VEREADLAPWIGPLVRARAPGPLPPHHSGGQRRQPDKRERTNTNSAFYPFRGGKTHPCDRTTHSGGPFPGTWALDEQAASTSVAAAPASRTAILVLCPVRVGAVRSWCLEVSSARFNVFLLWSVCGEWFSPGVQVLSWARSEESSRWASAWSSSARAFVSKVATASAPARPHWSPPPSPWPTASACAWSPKASRTTPRTPS